MIARGELGAERTLAWIARSTTWSLGDIAVDAQPWADHVRGLAQHILSNDTRSAQQKEAARALVAELFEDDQVAADIVDVGFDDLTEAIDESKITLAELLFKTAQQPSRDSVVARVAAPCALSFTCLHRGTARLGCPAGSHHFR